MRKLVKLLVTGRRGFNMHMLVTPPSVSSRCFMVAWTESFADSRPHVGLIARYGLREEPKRCCENTFTRTEHIAHGLYTNIGEMSKESLKTWKN